MGLESATFISQLVNTNPPTSDPETQGANHLQLIKSVLQNTFPDASKKFYLPKSLAKSATYSVVNTDDNTLFRVDASGGSVVLNLPTPTDAGWHIRVVRVDTSVNTVTIAPPSGTISGQASISITEQYRTSRFEWTGSTFITDTAPGIIVATDFKGGAVLGGITDGTIPTAKYADGSITTIKVADGNITLAKLETNAAYKGKILSWDISTGAPIVTYYNAVGAQLLHVREEQASGVAGVNTYTLNTFVKRNLTTVKTNEIVNASVNTGTDQISLPSGTYWIEGWTLSQVSGYGQVQRIKTRLRDVTNNVTLVVGEAAFDFNNPGGSGTTTFEWNHRSALRGRFALAGTVNLEFQLFCGGSATLNNARAAEQTVGPPAGVEVEVYTDIIILKIKD